ncbi:uroporphyrinogen-III synthase [Parvularcula sp. LCG005]|uniref:uroporphyrinogen-III synthase n=1 Tax=Parvularcula sp. LCG005 TaxID=3078805 RepID=UPI0029426B83|nr:uroporphyrinogen-III synthase [Parvularcula sp. LCG005]WOI53505.1 uroporphyrinogen-III synthase [Parvularcula sp. LCG005]
MRVILVTRPEPDATTTTALLKAQGLPAQATPLMTVEMGGTLPHPSTYDMVAFTSANGVRAYHQAMGPTGKPSYFVGEASAEAGRVAGLTIAGVGGHDVESLAKLILVSAPPGRVLHIRGHDQAGDLVGRLTDAGRPAAFAALYRAMAPTTLPDRLKTELQTGDAIVTLYSPRTAQLFAELCEKAGIIAPLTRCSAACLSENVAKVARRLPFQKVMVAQAPDQAHFVDMLLSARP